MTSQPTVSTVSSKNVDSQTVKASLYPLQPLEGPVPVGFQAKLAVLNQKGWVNISEPLAVSKRKGKETRRKEKRTVYRRLHSLRCILDRRTAAGFLS